MGAGYPLHRAGLGPEADSEFIGREVRGVDGDAEALDLAEAQGAGDHLGYQYLLDGIDHRHRRVGIEYHHIPGHQPDLVEDIGAFLRKGRNDELRAGPGRNRDRVCYARAGQFCHHEKVRRCADAAAKVDIRQHQFRIDRSHSFQCLRRYFQAAFFPIL